jgi:putative addiction module component (TIGR02574 family)
MAALDTVLQEALRLPDRERGELVARLLRSLEPDDGDEVGPEEWDKAWSEEIARRVGEVRDGSVELVDGDEVMAELDAIVQRP